MSSAPRFFVPLDAIAGETVVLPAEAAHHACNVLRLHPGESLFVHDGTGMVYACALSEGATGKKATARILEQHPTTTEPATRITVAQALPKTSDKIDQVLQHGTEAGASGFVFFTASRSVARLVDGDKIDKRLVRWRGIVQGASEQSGRGILPTVAWLPFAADVAKTFAEYDTVLILHEAAALPLRSVLTGIESHATKILVLVGPEGGLTDEEIALFTGAGGVPISLGPRILRTETAALIALAQILYERKRT